MKKLYNLIGTLASITKVVKAYVDIPYLLLFRNKWGSRPDEDSNGMHSESGDPAGACAEEAPALPVESVVWPISPIGSF
ncbi:hypothetical protein RG959_18535 [Domibacillus sp. 8LH]|uniref:hypothetical protein n=1 Tax=Domibacillus sp. 8LH TaxID=3073900 RepID=UPI0031701A9F